MLFYGKENELEPLLTSLVGTESRLVNPSVYRKYENARIDASDNVNITNTFRYSGDVVIGYRYTIDIAGVLTKFNPQEPEAIDPTNPNAHVTVDNNTYGHNMTSKLKRMDVLRRLVNLQGGVLYYTNELHEILFCARGCILKNLDFEQGTWTDRIPYKLSFESQEIDFFGTQKNTYAGLLDPDNSYSISWIDPRKHKIKEFSEDLNFTFEDMRSDIHYVDPESVWHLGEENAFYRITYNLSATGENWYTYNNKTIPAWEQAKLFCQKKLYKKITNMINSQNARILGIDYSHNNNVCWADQNLPNLYLIPPNHNVIFDGSDNKRTFKIYNEQLNTSVSESEGTFSVVYNAIVKAGDVPYIHKYTKSLDFSSNDANKKISMKGTFTGLTPGGLFNGELGSVWLPDQGYFIMGTNNNDFQVNKRFDKAQMGFDKISTNGETDLKDAFKELLGITHANLVLEGYDSAISCSTFRTPYPRASSFNVIKNWHEGTIDWEAEYDSKLDCAGARHSSVDIQINRSCPIKADITIPNGATITPLNPYGIGSYIVYIGAYSNATMDVTIKGWDTKYCGWASSPDAPQTLANFIANSNIEFNFWPEIAMRLPSPNTTVLTKKQKNLNIFTGEYTLGLSYILCNPGCPITQGL